MNQKTNSETKGFAITNIVLFFFIWTFVAWILHIVFQAIIASKTKNVTIRVLSIVGCFIPIVGLVANIMILCGYEKPDNEKTNTDNEKITLNNQMI
ncbi:hypothetical protein [Mycoplasmopsis felifaucium]|uniref:hypothetical protein n=1 Tax=Mycoplasmopsis felifaucium TaxID=35768 RepID=UPI000482A699|nr:hypothetical protein [Mycoplasmopsis felifaucium]